MKKEIIDKILAEKRILTTLDIKKLMQIESDNTLYKFVERLNKSGIIKRIAKGLYHSRMYEPEKLEIANLLYQPSYISFESALNFYGILIQTPFVVTSATLNKTKNIQTNYGEFHYTKITQKRYFGYVKHGKFLIATPEKALLDEFYLMSKGMRHVSIEELDFSGINKKLLFNYVKKMQYNPLIKLIEEAGF